jgi:hypothetical protein
VALGYEATAGNAGAVAIGAFVTTSRDNQIAIGGTGNTVTMVGITNAASLAAQSGAIQVVTTDANGNLATDGGALSTAIGDLDTRVDTNTADIATLDGRVDGHDTAIATLDGRVDGHDTDIATLTSRANGHDTAITSLTGQVAGNTTAITTLTGRVDGNAAAITTLSGRVDANTSDIAGINARLDAMGGGFANLGAEVGQNREGIAMAMAMDVPYVPADKDFALSTAFGHFGGSTAFGLSGAWRLGPDVQLDLGIGATKSYQGGRVGMTWAW